MQSASMEGKQNTPSKGDAASARKSAGRTIRRLASSCFSTVERNIRVGPVCRVATPATAALSGQPRGDRNGLTRDKLGRNATIWNFRQIHRPVAASSLASEFDQQNIE